MVATKDAIHAGEESDFIISREILLSLGQQELAQASGMRDALYFVPERDAIMKLVRQRQEILKNAWLSYIRGNRSGKNKGGSSVSEATARAAVISRQITRFRQTPPPNPFGHALVPDMIADASIQVINGSFYCYATTDGYDNGLKTSGPPVVWKSEDFVNWSFSGCLFPSAFGHKYWAPVQLLQRTANISCIRLSTGLCMLLLLIIRKVLLSWLPEKIHSICPIHRLHY
ncbi:hypothetical protein LWM68_19890 [Niabella sp. W65]|nr:hypothetical protein [Niabella sp. W65]MCH7364822.1 hypothetical protein [Niabella sp. W65]